MATLAELPEYMTPLEVARVVRKTPASLAQDRYLGRGLPYIKVGTEKNARVLYARADVAAFLAAHRNEPVGAA
ncbi:MAG: DNA-binding protein [Mycobacterium sp.]